MEIILNHLTYNWQPRNVDLETVDERQEVNKHPEQGQYETDDHDEQEPRRARS